MLNEDGPSTGLECFAEGLKQTDGEKAGIGQVPSSFLEKGWKESVRDVLSAPVSPLFVRGKQACTPDEDLAEHDRRRVALFAWRGQVVPPKLDKVTACCFRAGTIPSR